MKNSKESFEMKLEEKLYKDGSDTIIKPNNEDRSRKQKS
jgi:hypothetical protein